jgi:hypothetical protein
VSSRPARAGTAALVLVGLIAGCGDDLPAPVDAAAPPPRLAQLGHADLGGRGMNAALALAGDTAYVGSRIDGQPVLIVDVADPRAPTVVGSIPDPALSAVGMSSRELRVVPELDLLVVLMMTCSPALHGCGGPAAEREHLRLYDLSDRRAPRLVGRHDVVSAFRRERSPHEFYLWRDPARPGRVLALLTTPPGPDGLEVVDLTDPAAPRTLLMWDAVEDGGLTGLGGDNLAHSISASVDGRVGYLSHQQGGLVALDLTDLADDAAAPAVRLKTPAAAALDWSPPSPIGPHSATLVPGRPLVVVTDEVYPPPFAPGCPWGHLRVVDVADPTALRVTGEFRVAENDPAYCGSGAPLDRVAFTAHNTTATASLALVSWYGAGLQVVDLTDPAAPTGLTEFRPAPLPSVTTEDPGLGGTGVAMWSYPVVQDGLIYVVDIRNGLYVLRYRGPHDDELAGLAFAEGNSNR